MKKFLLPCVAVAFLALAVFCVDAEAKRVGGGGSFGGRTTYSKPYSRPVSPTSGATQNPTQVTQPRTATPAPGAAPAAAPGMGSRLGWGLGGLLAGGLIGSMLFGGGMGGGFGGGFGILEIVLIGLIIFMVVKLIRRRKQAAEQNATPGAQAGQWQRPPTDIRSQAENSWDNLRSTPSASPTAAGGFGDGSAAAATAEPPQPIVPEGFSIPEFLEGAKTVYTRLQNSWDSRNLSDIALFTTPEVLAEITRQAQADPGPSKTELLMINARLLEFKEDPKDTVATVFFDVLMREDVGEDRPKQVREVWHFQRETANPESNWRLEGIQQLDE